MAQTTYTKEQVQKLVSEAKSKIEQLQSDIAARDVAIKELKVTISSYETKGQDAIKKVADLERREAVLAGKEQVVAQIEAREIAVAAQEKAFEAIKDSLVKASEELAAKKAELFKNAEKLVADLHEKRIAETEELIQKMRNAANASCEKLRAGAEAEAQKIIEKAKSDTAVLENQIAELSARNTQIQSENTKLVSENKSLSDTLKGYINTMSAFETLKEQLKTSGKSVADFTKEIAGMDTREQQLNAKNDELNERERKLVFIEKRNQNKAQELDERESSIDEEIKKRCPEILADKDREIEALKKEAESLRNSLYANSSIIAKFDDLVAQFGGKNPVEILADYDRVKHELSIALDKVNNTPSYALQKEAADLHEKENALNDRENALTQKERESQQIHDKFALVQAENFDLNRKYENLEKDKKFVEEQLARLRSTYENPAERSERIAEINKPLFTENMKRARNSGLREMDWLKDIDSKIKESGLYFPKRILKAFHTALKTSEMSPLTVLAGVSGTGKSELPRLYSRFGGINFLSAPVQPNWDCQESMLGYYNSIDNCFEPTEMLRLLAQSQRDKDDQNGLNDVMTMILLDEMNLANVELYFADFLSKLETRRGLADNDPTFPKIGVKIGSKMEDFPLKLGRNVLWTGTMNNDETTKTLSDKVLDRGIVINFPRPKEFIRSRKNSVLAAPSPLLSKITWESWGKGYDFSEEEVKGYKEKVQLINEQLGKTGRALGHRVWQSIENYMSLYPDVIAAKSSKERERAMNDAFEDQLVQKVMPKLRGLETRGSQNEVLEAIKGIIPETLHEDYKNAAEQNYGQFIWTTSGYLLREEDTAEKKTEEASVVELKTEKPEKKAEASVAKAPNSITTTAYESKFLQDVEKDTRESYEKGKFKNNPQAEISNYLKMKFGITEKSVQDKIISSVLSEMKNRNYLNKLFGIK